MKKFLVLLTVGLISLGCEKIDGQLNVTVPVKLKTSKGSVITIKEGSYNSELKINSSKKLTLSLDNSKNKYEFAIPKNSLPDNGTFKLSAGTSGQLVDILGEVKTVVADGPRRRTTESCFYQVPVQVCTPLPSGGHSCHIQYRQQMGMKWVEYFDRTTDRDVKLAINNKGLTDNAADFFGDARYVQRVIVHETMCR